MKADAKLYYVADWVYRQVTPMGLECQLTGDDVYQVRRPSGEVLTAFGQGTVGSEPPDASVQFIGELVMHRVRTAMERE